MNFVRLLKHCSECVYNDMLLIELNDASGVSFLAMFDETTLIESHDFINQNAATGKTDEHILAT